MIFENAPFKLTQDYMTLIGGEKSPLYAYLHILLIQGFTCVRKHAEELCDLIEIMSKDSSLPCFEKFNLEDFRNRLAPDVKDSDMPRWVQGLMKDSLGSKRTAWYDDFQKVSNGIAP